MALRVLREVGARAFARQSRRRCRSQVLLSEAQYTVRSEAMDVAGVEVPAVDVRQYLIQLGAIIAQ
jgi:hypothetical protein